MGLRKNFGHDGRDYSRFCVLRLPGILLGIRSPESFPRLIVFPRRLHPLFQSPPLNVHPVYSRILMKSFCMSFSNTDKRKSGSLGNGKCVSILSTGNYRLETIVLGFHVSTETGPGSCLSNVTFFLKRIYDFFCRISCTTFTVRPTRARNVSLLKRLVGKRVTGCWRTSCCS